MNKIYKSLYAIEHYIFKKDGDFVFLNVNTLDVYVLNEIEGGIIKEINKHPTDYRFSVLIEKHGEPIIVDSIENLLENGILKKENEKRKAEKQDPAYEKDIVESFKTMEILISEDCNLACKYCFVKNGHYYGKSTLMELDVGKKSIDFLIKKSGNQKNLFVNFFGGEPLINFKILEKIVIYAIKQGEKWNKKFYFSLTTNGTLLSNETVNFINKHQISVLISIDGDVYSQNINRPFSGGGGSYLRIIDNLKNLNQKKISYSARATVSSLTINKIAENFEHLLSLGFKKVHFANALSPTGKMFLYSKNDIKEIKKQYSSISKKVNRIIESGQSYNIETFPLPLVGIIEKNKKNYPCSAGRGNVCVDVNGNIYLCHRLVGVERFLLGNVTDDTYNFKWTEFIKSKLNVDIIKKCKKCWARYICGGGCYAINYEFNEDISLTPRIYCQLKKHSIKLALSIYTNISQNIESQTIHNPS